MVVNIGIGSVRYFSLRRSPGVELAEKTAAEESREMGRYWPIAYVTAEKKRHDRRLPFKRLMKI